VGNSCTGNSRADSREYPPLRRRHPARKGSHFPSTLSLSHHDRRGHSSCPRSLSVTQTDRDKVFCPHRVSQTDRGHISCPHNLFATQTDWGHNPRPHYLSSKTNMSHISCPYILSVTQTDWGHISHVHSFCYPDGLGSHIPPTPSLFLTASDCKFSFAVMYVASFTDLANYCR
jgi:hypothetical protein